MSAFSGAWVSWVGVGAGPFPGTCSGPEGCWHRGQRSDLASLRGRGGRTSCARKGDVVLSQTFLASPLAHPAPSLPSSPCGWTRSSSSSAWRMRLASRLFTTTTAGWPTTGTRVRSRWSWWGRRVSDGRVRAACDALQQGSVRGPGRCGGIGRWFPEGMVSY